MYASPASAGETLFLIVITILLYQYVNLLEFKQLKQLRVVIALGLTSSHPEQRS